MICESAYEKKADEIVVMEMNGKSALCDYFIVMSAPSTVRVRAIVDFIEEQMKNEGMPLKHKEGYKESTWVLMDFGEVIAHVFHQETRRFYDLEKLWGDAPKRHYLK